MGITLIPGIIFVWTATAAEVEEGIEDVGVEAGLGDASPGCK